MKVLKPRSALLSDFEVLRVLKDIEAEQKQRSEQAKSRNTAALDTIEDSVNQEDEWLLQVPENLRTIQYETIAFLSQTSRPCAHQTEEGVISFLDALKASGYSIKDSEARRGLAGLNKSERLQIVNHAPQSVVELHTLVEELSERFYDDQVQDILSLVQAHIPAGRSEPINAYAEGAVNGVQTDAEMTDGHFDTAATDLGGQGEHGLAVVPTGDDQNYDEYEQDAGQEMDEDEFVNEGYGVTGVEDAEPDE